MWQGWGCQAGGRGVTGRRGYGRRGAVARIFFFKVVGSTTIISDEGLIFCTSGSLLRLSKRHGPSPVWGICLVWAGPGP